MKLENGRPENTEGRLEKEIRVYDFLDKLGVEYQRVDHEAAMTMEACEEIDRTLGDGTAICKNLFLCNRQETDFYLLLIDEDIMKDPYFGCHPCINTSSLKIRTSDLIAKIIPALKHAPKMVKLPGAEEQQ